MQRLPPTLVCSRPACRSMGWAGHPRHRMGIRRRRTQRCNAGTASNVPMVDDRGFAASEMCGSGGRVEGVDHLGRDPAAG
jgi:hypothetical protein